MKPMFELTHKKWWHRFSPVHRKRKKVFTKLMNHFMDESGDDINAAIQKEIIMNSIYGTGVPSQEWIDNFLTSQSK